jgi:small subunit ribosomal protein S18
MSIKKKLFVSNLDFEVTSEQLREAVDAIAPSSSVVVAVDRDSKRSKGFAFVEMQNEESARSVSEQLNGFILNGRPIKVVEDRGKGGTEGTQKKFEPLPPIQRMQLFRRKKKLDPFTEDPEKPVDYRDIAVLSRFVSERGRILSRRLTGLKANNQRKVSKAIKRAQNLGLIPFSNV